MPGYDVRSRSRCGRVIYMPAKVEERPTGPAFEFFRRYEISHFLTDSHLNF